jgi:hypothetical protein
MEESINKKKLSNMDLIHIGLGSVILILIIIIVVLSIIIYNKTNCDKISSSSIIKYKSKQLLTDDELSKCNEELNNFNKKLSTANKNLKFNTEKVETLSNTYLVLINSFKPLLIKGEEDSFSLHPGFSKKRLLNITNNAVNISKTSDNDGFFINFAMVNTDGLTYNNNFVKTLKDVFLFLTYEPKIMFKSENNMLVIKTEDEFKNDQDKDSYKFILYHYKNIQYLKNIKYPITDLIDYKNSTNILHSHNLFIKNKKDGYLYEWKDDTSNSDISYIKTYDENTFNNEIKAFSDNDNIPKLILSNNVKEITWNLTKNINMTNSNYLKVPNFDK